VQERQETLANPVVIDDDNRSRLEVGFEIVRCSKMTRA